jgi:hypothetical protein
MDEPPSALSVQLDAQISKLKKALHYWQMWEAEYEGLKEVLDGLADPLATHMVGSAIQTKQPDRSR